MCKITIILFAMTCALSSLTSAQEQASIQFVSFPKAADPEPLELVIGEGETIKVNVPTNRVSDTYKIPLLSSWVLGKTKEDDEGKPQFNVLGKTKALGKSKQLILVIRNGYTNDKGLKLIAMPNDESKIGGGTFFFMNVSSDYQIAGKVTESRFSIKPGNSVVIKPAASKVNGRYKYCEALLAYRKGDIDRPFYTQTWRLHEEIRNFIFFYQDPTTKKLKLHIIEDYLP